jgi:hypothetical protein
MKLTHPENGPVVGLAQDIGVIELRLLLPETESNRTKVADIVIAYYACASGLILIFVD